MKVRWFKEIFNLTDQHMRNIICILGALALAWAAAMPVRADEAVETVKTAGMAGAGDGAGRLHYAPDRTVAVLHVALDVTPDFRKRTVAGTAVLSFKPIAKPVREIELDAVGLTVEALTATAKVESYQVTADKIVVTFADRIPADQTTAVTVRYHAQPDLGLYFRTPEMGYKEGDTHCFSQGEETEARHWYPCFDAPNEKFTSEVTCRVPAGMTVVSNGRLVAQTTDAATGLTVFHWSQELPHANYLICLVAGYFKELNAQHKDVPLAFLTPPSEFAEAANSFRETDDIMGFFEDEIGVPFPWVKYDQTVVNDFVAGGMENTSATTLTDRALFQTNSESIGSSAGLVAHEMAHQWFGDLVTCKEWSDIWLNEGFATYYQIRYTGHKDGQDAMLYDLYGAARGILGVENDVNPIVRRNYVSSHEMFNYLAYPKGAWVLHMLRSQLGDELYRRCIKTYLERHRYGNVVTDDLRKVIEELSGRSYDQFFDQWLYHAHYPELAVEYSWDEQTKLAKISVKQQQPVSDSVLLFDFPLTVRFKGAFGTADQTVQVKTAAAEFYFPLAAAPEIVRVDPEYTLLAKTAFSLPDAMLFAQLKDRTDVVGRLLAVEQLAQNQDDDTVDQLKRALKTDGFYGVRQEAAKALRTIHTDEALAALLDSGEQPDARVRRAVVAGVAGFYQAGAEAFLAGVADTEQNPEIRAEAIRGLGIFGNPEIHGKLVAWLNTESFHEMLAGAAIEAMRAQGDPAFAGPLLQALPRLEANMADRSFDAGLDTLAWLARNETNKEAVRNYLTARLTDRKQGVKVKAITALGTLGDPQAVAVLETFATAAKDTPERAAAAAAVAQLRADRKPADDLKELRSEVTELQQDNRALQQDLDDLKKEVEATAAAGKKRKFW